MNTKRKATAWGDEVYRRMDVISKGLYGKKYDELPEDGVEQNHVQKLLLIDVQLLVDVR